jgi:hypothetical protein
LRIFTPNAHNYINTAKKSINHAMRLLMSIIPLYVHMQAMKHISPDASTSGRKVNYKNLMVHISAYKRCTRAESLHSVKHKGTPLASE